MLKRCLEAILPPCPHPPHMNINSYMYVTGRWHDTYYWNDPLIHMERTKFNTCMVCRNVQCQHIPLGSGLTDTVDVQFSEAALTLPYNNLYLINCYRITKYVSLCLVWLQTKAAGCRLQVHPCRNVTCDLWPWDWGPHAKVRPSAVM